MTLQEKLKTATSRNHDELESLMFVNEIMNKTLKIQQYEIILITNYLVHKIYEKGIHHALDPAFKSTLKIERRNKLSSLE